MFVPVLYFVTSHYCWESVGFVKQGSLRLSHLVERTILLDNGYADRQKREQKRNQDDITFIGATSMLATKVSQVWLYTRMYMTQCIILMLAASYQWECVSSCSVDLLEVDFLA